MDDKDQNLLSKVTFVKDYRDRNGRKACVKRRGEETEAELRERDTESPKVVICDIAFELGGIDKREHSAQHSNPVPKRLRCDQFDNRLSENMFPMSALLLHEYTHYVALLSPWPLPKGTRDYCYGPYKVQRLRKSKARFNADGYAWYATEVFLTLKCQKPFRLAPDEELDSDNSDYDSNSVF